MLLKHQKQKSVRLPRIVAILKVALPIWVCLEMPHLHPNSAFFLMVLPHISLSSGQPINFICLAWCEGTSRRSALENPANQLGCFAQVDSMQSGPFFAEDAP